MTNRREFLRDSLVAAAALAPLTRSIRLAIPADRLMKRARLAVIADLHFGLAPDALTRFQAFLAERARRTVDATLQMGDFCYSDASATECLALWRRLRGQKLSILGNHDMDKCDKKTAMRAFGMPSRYYARTIGGYRFVVLDLNNFRKDGALVPYANGNYFTDNATFNCADPEQLAWLRSELEASRDPVIILSHQPLGFAEAGQPLPPEQQEVFDVIRAMGRRNPRGAVAACLSGHLHVDRLEQVDDIPCLLLNSASYFWYQGMHPYTEPLFAFLEFTEDGVLRVEGRQGAFVSPPPPASDNVLGRAAVISDRNIQLALG